MKNRFLAVGLLICICLISCGVAKKSSVTASKVEWVDFTTGYVSAKESGKILLVDVYTDWCGWCKKMDRDTYTDSAVIQTLHAEYVCVKLNPEKAINYTMEGKTYSALQIKNLLSENRRNGYPSTYFMKPAKAKKVVALVGYQGPSDFNKTLTLTVPSKL